jgi:hypothetical protein
MAIVDITFTNVTITESGDGHNTGALTGTLVVNTSAPSATGALDFTGVPGGTFTSFTLTGVGTGPTEVFTLTSGSGTHALKLTWTGPTPSAPSPPARASIWSHYLATYIIPLSTTP